MIPATRPWGETPREAVPASGCGVTIAHIVASAGDPGHLPLACAGCARPRPGNAHGGLDPASASPTGRLTVAGRDAEASPRARHAAVRVRPGARRGAGAALRAAFDGAGLTGRVRLALKAQHEPGLPAVPARARAVRRHGRVLAGRAGVGARARLAGRRDQLHRHEPLGSRPRAILPTRRPPQRRPAVAARSGGRTAPGRSSASGSTRARARGSPAAARRCTRARPTKFGIFPERLDDALEIARRHDLTIDTVHVHSGYLYLNDGSTMSTRSIRGSRR